jgi:hypothetical protein
MVSYGGGIDPLRMLHTVQVQLGRPVKNMAYLLPVDQIPAVKNRNSGVIGKA